MGIETKLEELGIRSPVGLASLLCSKDAAKILDVWSTGVGFIVLKTMMDAEERPEKPLIKEIMSADNNTNFYHSGTTDKEQYNFHDDADRIIELVNSLYSNGVAAILSIGTKKTDIEPWEKIEDVLEKTEARVLELNLRYLYRGLLAKHRRGITLNEYLNNEAKEAKADDINRATYLANEEFGYILKQIREVFPKGVYSLIAKLWACDEIKLHLMYAEESGFDAVTLLNSIKKEPPEPFEKIPKSKMPQMSGMELRQHRDYTLRLARRMGYRLPIFASGGVAIEAIRDISFDGISHLPKEILLQKNFQDAIADIRRCFELGASYVQLGSVGYFRGPNGNAPGTISKLMQGITDGYSGTESQLKTRTA